MLAKQLNSHTIDNGMDVVYLDIAKNATMCSNSEYYKSLYMHFFVVAVSILLGQIIALILVDILGRSVILGKLLFNIKYIECYLNILNKENKLHILSNICWRFLYSLLGTQSIICWHKLIYHTHTFSKPY